METRSDVQGGFTLVEVMAVLLVTTVVVYTTFQLSKTSHDAGRHVVSQARATEVAQSIVDRMRDDLLSSVELFQNDVAGAAYLALLEADPDTTPIIDALPTGTFDETFGLETASAERTGNNLMLARHDWSDDYECISGNAYRIDVYRIVRYHLTRAGRGPRDGSPSGLNLARWVSEPMADGSQIDAIPDLGDRQEVLQHFRSGSVDANGTSHPPIEVAWIPGGDLAMPDTLRYVDDDGSLAEDPASTRGSVWTIRRDERRSAEGLLFYRHYSVATNFAHPGMGVGRYSVSHNTADGFPHGFEVQIVGSSRSRQVLLQLCVVSTRRQGLPAWAQMRSAVHVRGV